MALPEYISVNDYLKEVRDDISSPTTSTFVSKMQACKNTAIELEEVCSSLNISFKVLPINMLRRLFWHFSS
ncbi:UNVERIFIED_CONTAM: hypothetical protein RMT77_001365 [Armadillidium vulgare]